MTETQLRDLICVVKRFYQDIPSFLEWGKSVQIPIAKIVDPSRGFHLNLYTYAVALTRFGGYTHRVVVYTDQIPRK